MSLTIQGDRLPPAPQSAEGSLAGCLTFCRWLTGDALRPLEVCFQGPQPADLEPYRQLFQAPLRFGAPRYALLFREADVNTPLPTANEALAQLHDRFAGEYLSRFADSRVMHRARQILCRLLPQGDALIDREVPERRQTMQRRLQEEGGSFQQLLDDTRRDLAEQYLAQPDLAPLEIAYLLGFADPSNFYRAFKRWFGVTPGEYRLAARARR